MRLAVHRSGSGPRAAVLIHGMMSDHRAWHRVAAELQGDGYRVIAVDLAGHGASPRSRRYSPRRWAADVVETLEAELDGPPELLMGHSLGALVASLVAERFAPRVAIYVDPAFAFPRGVRGVALKAMFTVSPRPGAWVLRRLNPGWTTADVELEVATLRVWDKRTILGFVNTRPLVPPLKLVAPSLVILAERSLLISRAVAESLRQSGMTVTTIAGSGHTVFRDDHAGFMHLVRGWVTRHTSLPVGHTLPVG
ncbi:alpha/beta fold hydrolase, partial [Pseudolysinimonas sp.]|uniref:alpha/beta fold hydrolase n=1 Tax=Pseudolysinimonas sp. TaxID=2680009 RepID=UPI00286A02AC